MNIITAFPHPNCPSSRRVRQHNANIANAGGMDAYVALHESASDVEWGVDADNDVDEVSDDGYGLDDPLAEAGEGGGY